VRPKHFQQPIFGLEKRCGASGIINSRSGGALNLPNMVIQTVGTRLRIFLIERIRFRKCVDGTHDNVKKAFTQSRKGDPSSVVPECDQLVFDVVVPVLGADGWLFCCSLALGF
jgi:hypothetical protein